MLGMDYLSGLVGGWALDISAKRVTHRLVAQFVIRVTYSRTGDNERGFETMVLVGQASCLSFLDRQARCLSHQSFPKYVTELMKPSTFSTGPACRAPTVV